MAQKLAEIFERLQNGLGPTLKTCEQLSLWQQVAGEKVRQHTEAIKIRNRTLYVNASSSTWAQELSFLKGEFIAKFNQVAGEEAIRDIRFGSGG